MRLVPPPRRHACGARPPAPPATRPPPSAATSISRPAEVHRDSRSRRRANPGAPNPPRRGRPAPAPPQARSPLDRLGDRVERRREPTGRLNLVVGLAPQERHPAGLAVDLALVPPTHSSRMPHARPAHTVPPTTPKRRTDG